MKARLRPLHIGSSLDSDVMYGGGVGDIVTNECSPEVKAPSLRSSHDTTFRFSQQQQHSLDSDVMYGGGTDVITNSVLAELEAAAEAAVAMQPLYVEVEEVVSEVEQCRRPQHESEPFLVSRTPLCDDEGGVQPPPAESPRSEASLLDLVDMQDVEYADASASDEEEPQLIVEKTQTTAPLAAEDMTQAEADNLLSSRCAHI